jgi:hypothetical protein
MSSRVSRRADELNEPPPERQRDASEDRMEVGVPQAESRRLRNALILMNVVAWLLIIVAVRWVFSEYF